MEDGGDTDDPGAPAPDTTGGASSLNPGQPSWLGKFQAAVKNIQGTIQPTTGQGQQQQWNTATPYQQAGKAVGSLAAKIPAVASFLEDGRRPSPYRARMMAQGGG